MTNFEKLKADIQSMTVDEFALKLHNFVCDNIPKEDWCDESYSIFGCDKCKLQWLKSEVDNEH